MLGIVAQEEGEKQGGKEEKETKIRKQQEAGNLSLGQDTGLGLSTVLNG